MVRKTLALTCLALLVSTAAAATARATTFSESGLSFTVPDDLEVSKTKNKNGVTVTSGFSRQKGVGVIIWTVQGPNAKDAYLTSLKGISAAMLEGVNCGTGAGKEAMVNGMKVSYFACGARLKANGQPVGVQVNLYPAGPQRALVMVAFWAKTSATAKPIIAGITGSVRR